MTWQPGARRLAESAPDRSRHGWAAFWGGTIADNLHGEPAHAAELFREALAAGEDSGDDLLSAEALRHLGYAADQAGDRATARHHWLRSAELRQRAGNVPGVLSQHVLLAGQLGERGDAASARALAAEAGRWAATLGILRVAAQAAEISTG